LRKFEDIDIISALRKIVDNNNLFYKTDFNYDVETLKTAAAGSHFLWLSRTSGTSLYSERDAHIRNHEAHNAWPYYSDTKYYGVNAFAVEVVENSGGRPIGNIYELDYDKNREEIRKNSFSARTVDVTFKSNHLYPETIRTIDVAEYNDRFRSLVNRYGEVSNVKYNLSVEDDTQLSKILTASRERREAEATPANLGDYIREIVRERFHEYGYKRDDMVFTTPDDAVAALKHHIPVHILYPNNTSDRATTTVEIDKSLFAGFMFGMSATDKRLLNFYQAGNTLADLPFSHRELSTIFHMALDRGKENIEDEQQRKAVDGIIQVLDTILFSNDGRDVDEITLDRDLDESEGYEP